MHEFSLASGIVDVVTETVEKPAGETAYLGNRRSGTARDG